MDIRPLNQVRQNDTLHGFSYRFFKRYKNASSQSLSQHMGRRIQDPISLRTILSIFSYLTSIVNATSKFPLKLVLLWRSLLQASSVRGWFLFYCNSHTGQDDKIEGLCVEAQERMRCVWKFSRPVIVHFFDSRCLAVWVIYCQWPGQPKICNFDKAWLLGNFTTPVLKWHTSNHQICRLQVSVDDHILAAIQNAGFSYFEYSLLLGF